MIGVLNELAARHRYRQVNRSQIEELRGRPTREVMRELGVSPWRLPFIAADMRKRSAADAKGIPMFPGVPEFLRDLTDAGVTAAIVSSNGEATVRRVLGECQHLIDVYECEVSLFGKQRKLRGVARKLAVPPERALYVGDETRDVQAAKAAGLDSAAVSWGYSTQSALAGARPTYLIDSLRDLAAAIEDQPILRLVR
jgi:phosphoglycolate phosphatase